MHQSEPVIAFLTAAWADIDNRIRAGQPPGGVPSVSRIWTECLSNGYKVHVFITTILEPGWPAETTELNGVRFHWIQMPFPRAVRWLHRRRLIGAAKMFSWMWHRRMKRRIAATGVVPDIIYLMRSTFALTGRWWARRSGAKLVLRQYGTWIYQYWGTRGNYFNRLQTLGEYVAMRMPMDLFIMTNDGSMGDRAARLARVPQDKFRFWINGVDKALRIEDFDKPGAKSRLGVPAQAPVIMTLGRLAWWKRLDRVINAMPHVLAKHPETRLVVVGDGPLRPDLEKRARQRGVAERIVFVGAVSHQDIAGYLNLCDVFVMSNDLTNMCNTLIEAITCGCCVVTRDVGDTTTIAKHGVNAIVLSPGEAEEFADAILGLLSDATRRRALGDGAYRWAMSNLQTWDERMGMEGRELSRLIGYTPGPGRETKLCGGLEGAGGCGVAP